jgi:[acyl-carrier-protein] S-malonyltransferase
MGQDWLQNPLAHAVFDAADEALGFSISKICFEGPEDELKLTANQQPAILTVSYAIYQCIREELPEVAFFAGHSLGEYTALVAAGAMELGEAVEVVNQRGRLMQEAVPVGAGAMAAVLKLDAAKIEEINAAVAQETGADLVIANYNSPEQVVVSGSANAVAMALPRYTEAGARRVVELPVSAPFHSPLMVSAADGLKPRLEACKFRAPLAPVVANLTVQPYPQDTAEHARLLHAQIFNPVRWTETQQYFAAQEVTHLLEIGPGKVLRMLAAKTIREVGAFNIEAADELGKLKDWLGQSGEAGA